MPICILNFNYKLFLNVAFYIKFFLSYFEFLSFSPVNQKASVLLDDAAARQQSV